MQEQQHLCGQLINVEAFQSHGETILYLEDPRTRQQIEHCPECGEEIFENTLFPLDICPAWFAEMAEQQVEV